MKPCINEKCEEFFEHTSGNCKMWHAHKLKHCPHYMPESGEAQSTSSVAQSELTTTQQLIETECDYIKRILLAKNRKYGDSAVHPIRVFSKADPMEQINVRLDDKLSRLMNRQEDEDEDIELDLIGYLILKRVAKFITAEDYLK